MPIGLNRKSLPILVLLVAALSLAVAASAATAAPRVGGDLYVLQASGGKLEGSKLVLRGVDPAVTSFADRPARSAGSLSVARFAAGWKRIFGSDAPNAALTVQGAPAGRDVAVLELRHPRYDRRRHTLTYSVRRLGKTGDRALEAFDRRADGDAVHRFGRASLFIDDGGAPLVPLMLTAELPSEGGVKVKFTNTEIAQGVVGGREVGSETGTFFPAESAPAQNAGGSILLSAHSAFLYTISSSSSILVSANVYVVEPPGGVLTGSALLIEPEPGVRLTLTNLAGEAFPITNGNFSVPVGEPE